MTKLTKTSGPSRRGIVKAAARWPPASPRRRCCACVPPMRLIRIVRSNRGRQHARRAVGYRRPHRHGGAHQSTGKTFIVENRGGAGGNIGIEYVAHAEPDGYTILLATNAYSVNLGLYNTLPFDPYKDLSASASWPPRPTLSWCDPNCRRRQ